jgi:hypothetical protein
MKNILHLIVIAIFSFSARAQDWQLELSSNVELRSWKLTSEAIKTEKPLRGASIVLSKVSGAVVTQTTSDGNGDFTVMVPQNDEFVLTVSFSNHSNFWFRFRTKCFSLDNC